VPRVDPSGQDRAGTERFKNSAAHNPERLTSYRRAREFYPVSRYHLPGCPREASSTAHPFARLSLLGFLRDPPSRGASAPIELDHVFTARAFRRRTAVTKDASDRRLQSHIFKDEHSHFARLPTCSPELPPVPADERHGSRRATRFGRHLLHHTGRCLLPMWRMKRRTADVSVTVQVSHSSRPVSPGRPRPFHHRIA
jgi:hypothetical protein